MVEILLNRQLYIEGVLFGFAEQMRRPLHSFTEKQKGRGKLNYTYIVKCSDGTFYTGWTNCLEKRIACHNAGKGAKIYESAASGGTGVL